MNKQEKVYIDKVNERLEKLGWNISYKVLYKTIKEVYESLKKEKPSNLSEEELEGLYKRYKEEIESCEALEEMIKSNPELGEIISIRREFTPGTFGVPRLVGHTRARLIQEKETAKEHLRKGEKFIITTQGKKDSQPVTNKIQGTLEGVNTEEYIETYLNVIDTEIYRVFKALCCYLNGGRVGENIPLTDIMKIAYPNHKTFSMKERVAFTEKLGKLETLPRLRATQELPGGKKVTDILFRFMDFSGGAIEYSIVRKDKKEINPETGKPFKKGEVDRRVINKLSFKILEGIPVNMEYIIHSQGVFRLNPYKQAVAVELLDIIEKSTYQNYKKTQLPEVTITQKYLLENLPLTHSRADRRINTIERNLDTLKEEQLIKDWKKMKEGYKITIQEETNKAYKARKGTLKNKR